ncbi:hypothetical protein TcCL_NonESM10234, partial [Trypanosoma cruzi]
VAVSGGQYLPSPTAAPLHRRRRPPPPHRHNEETTAGDLTPATIRLPQSLVAAAMTRRVGCKQKRKTIAPSSISAQRGSTAAGTQGATPFSGYQHSPSVTRQRGNERAPPTQPSCNMSGSHEQSHKLAPRHANQQSKTPPAKEAMDGCGAQPQ